LLGQSFGRTSQDWMPILQMLSNSNIHNEKFKSIEYFGLRMTKAWLTTKTCLTTPRMMKDEKQ